MKVEALLIEEKILEKDFPMYIQNKGFSCIKCNRINKNLIISVLREIRDNTLQWDKINDIIDFELNNFFGVGSPDFFIYNKKEFFICEFKSRKDYLHKTQFNWISKNRHLPIMIAVVLGIKDFKPYKLLQVKKKKR